MRGIPAGDVDDEARGHGYALLRRTDPRIAALEYFGSLRLVVAR